MLNGKVVIVTGATGGIGVASCKVLSQAGAKLIIADLGSGGHDLAADLNARGGDCRFVECDVASENAVKDMVQAALSSFGRLDGAFNNAGVEFRAVPLHELTLADWNRVIDIDLTAVFLCMKHQIAAMLETGGGSIVNTSSALGQVAWINASEYVAAKHGVVGLTKAAALDYATQNIRVNAILPGTIKTPMVVRANTGPDMAANMQMSISLHPIGRLGEPEEIGEAAKWLLSDASSFVTGTSLPVDGGFLIV